MSLHSGIEAEREFELGRKALDKNDFETALAHFETALELKDNPCWYSYVGLCIDRERGGDWMGVELQESTAHHLNLAKVYLASGDKKEALSALREGLAKGGNKEILRMFAKMGVRNTPVFKLLPRSNPLNKLLGILIR